MSKNKVQICTMIVNFANNATSSNNVARCRYHRRHLTSYRNVNLPTLLGLFSLLKTPVLNITYSNVITNNN